LVMSVAQPKVQGRKDDGSCMYFLYLCSDSGKAIGRKKSTVFPGYVVSASWIKHVNPSDQSGTITIYSLGLLWDTPPVLDTSPLWDTHHRPPRGTFQRENCSGWPDLNGDQWVRFQNESLSTTNGPTAKHVSPHQDPGSSRSVQHCPNLRSCPENFELP
jgi:hypothetical protein